MQRCKQGVTHTELAHRTEDSRLRCRPKLSENNIATNRSTSRVNRRTSWGHRQSGALCKIVLSQKRCKMVRLLLAYRPLIGSDTWKRAIFHDLDWP